MTTRQPAADFDHDETPDPLYEHVRDPGDPDGVIAAERRREWQANQPAVSTPELPMYRSPKRWPWVLAAFTAVVGAITGAYFLGFQHAQVPIAKQEQTAQNKSERKTVTATTATKRHDSNNFSISFMYPDNWVVADTEDKLTVTSPKVSLVDSEGETDGHVIVTVRSATTSIPGYPGTATAGLASAQLTYKQPSPVQRKQTYLTFVDYEGAGTVNGLFLTGDNTYQVGEAVPMAQVVKGNPLVSVTFVTCDKSYCNGGKSTPLAITAASWEKASFKAPVINLLQSLVFN